MFVNAVRRRLCISPLYNILQDKMKSAMQSQQFPMYLFGQWSPPIDRQLFEDESFVLFVRLKTAFNKLKTIDDKVKDLRFNPDLLDVLTSVGNFVFTRDLDLTTVFFSSPISGVYKYYFDQQEKRWTSNKDRHILEDNLVRETSKYFKGYLQL